MRHGDICRQREQRMNVVRRSTDFDWFEVVITCDAAQNGPQITQQCVRNKGLALTCTEDDVQEIVAIGMWHRIPSLRDLRLSLARPTTAVVG